MSTKFFTNSTGNTLFDKFKGIANKFLTESLNATKYPSKSRCFMRGKMVVNM